jgi:hypothetical protein
MRKLIDYIRSEQWAMSVAITVAILQQIPSLVQLIEGELDSVESWNLTGLATVAAGVLIKGNVWARRTVEKIEADALHTAPPGQALVPAGVVALPPEGLRLDGSGALAGNVFYGSGSTAVITSSQPLVEAPVAHAEREVETAQTFRPFANLIVPSAHLPGVPPATAELPPIYGCE